MITVSEIGDIHRFAVPEMPGRREPRVIKRRKRTYQIMTEPRKEMKEIPHRNNYIKAA